MKSIRSIAAILSSTTTAEAKRALKAAGLRQTLAPEVLSAKAEIDRAHELGIPVFWSLEHLIAWRDSFGISPSV